MTEAVTPPTPSDVFAVVVTMAPDEGFARRLAALDGQVAGIVVVDNGSGPAADAILARVVAERGAELIRQPRNRGIAYALNRGAARAIERGARWILTLDQDARPLPGLVEQARRTYEAFPRRGQLAVIGGSRLGTPAPAGASAMLIEVPVLITAGSLVSTSAFGDIGPFREDLFIDYVDVEFCLRARRAGRHVVQGLVPTMEHDVGRPTHRRFLGREVIMTNHSPARRYYITRNRILVWKEYLRQEPRFVVRNVSDAVKEGVKLVLFEEQRPAKIRASWRGLLDGLRGSAGPTVEITATVPAPMTVRRS